MVVHSWAESIGTVAAVIGTITFVPQVIKVSKQGGRDLSWLMLFFYWTAVVLWSVYGILRHDKPLVAANLAIAVLITLTGWLKWRFERGAYRQPQD